MSAPFLMIDGYNLLHAAGLSQARYAPGDLQRQRHRLLVRLANLLTPAERVRCTVTFDAMEAPSGLEREYRHAEMRVLFAEPGHDADSLIEDLIESHASPTQLVVVSGDHRLQKAAKHRRAEGIDSEVFLRQLAERAKAAAKPAVPPPPKSTKSSGVDVSYWMDEFGEIDVEALARSDSPSADLPSTDPWEKGISDLQKRLDQDSDLDEWLNRRPGT